MHKISFYNRFTYSKTKDFWSILDDLISLHSRDSLDYSIIKRDKIIFQLFYSYGLTPSETLGLSISDFNFCNSEKETDSFGSIFISKSNIRLVYPIFSEVIEDISNYLDIYNLFLKKQSSSAFKTEKGNALTISYLNNRLNFYNSKLAPSKRINSLNTFRQYYIADLLKNEGISQSFINKQIGNNIISNQVYFHLHPNI